MLPCKPLKLDQQFDIFRRVAAKPAMRHAFKYVEFDRQGCPTQCPMHPHRIGKEQVSRSCLNEGRRKAC